MNPLPPATKTTPLSRDPFTVLTTTILPLEYSWPESSGAQRSSNYETETVCSPASPIFIFTRWYPVFDTLSFFDAMLYPSMYLQIWIRVKNWRNSSNSIQKAPSSAFVKFTCFLASGVQQFESSPQSPFHSKLPHGFLNWTILHLFPYLSLTVAHARSPYAWPPTRPNCCNLSPSSSLFYDTPAAII